MEGKKTNKVNFLQQCHIIIIILLIPIYFSTSTWVGWFLIYERLLNISVFIAKLSLTFLSLKPTYFTLSKLWLMCITYIQYLDN